MELDAFRAAVDRWLDENAEALAPETASPTTLDQHMAQLTKVKALAFDAGWIRWGWPERVGGLGGSPLLRGYLGEALTTRDLVDANSYSMTEVLAPTMIDYARPELAATMVPRLLRGDELWCQGFSEPGTGSNLGALSCRATRTDDGWRVTGQKVWTSYADHAQRCVLLTRTGTPESAHRGITAMFVDMDSPGITVRPLGTMPGSAEFCEVFFDDVTVPFERTLGEEGEGWSVAMAILPFERSTALWHRGALLNRRLEQFLESVPPGTVGRTPSGSTGGRRGRRSSTCKEEPTPPPPPSTPSSPPPWVWTRPSCFLFSGVAPLRARWSASVSPSAAWAPEPCNVATELLSSPRTALSSSTPPTSHCGPSVASILRWA